MKIGQTAPPVHDFSGGAVIFYVSANILRRRQMRRSAVGLVAFGGVLTGVQAAAQSDIKTRGYFGVGGGLSIPVGDFSEAAAKRR